MMIPKKKKHDKTKAIPIHLCTETKRRNTVK